MITFWLRLHRSMVMYVNMLRRSKKSWLCCYLHRLACICTQNIHLNIFILGFKFLRRIAWRNGKCLGLLLRSCKFNLQVLCRKCQRLYRLKWNSCTPPIHALYIQLVISLENSLKALVCDVPFDKTEIKY